MDKIELAHENFDMPLDFVDYKAELRLNVVPYYLVMMSVILN